ncbi:SprT-like family-domain-containing protein [Hypoxylon sp. NC1633]|nr:SprT-like family-domain-containing protein [Hypoxylon sp. NC1633]
MMPQHDTTTDESFAKMVDGLEASSDDEFPDIDVVIRQYQHRLQEKQVGRKAKGDKEYASITPKSKVQMEGNVKEETAKPCASVKVTPLRRRKLGQSQTVDRSLLKPWKTMVTVHGEDQISKPGSSQCRLRGASAEADDSEPLSTEALKTASRAESRRLQLWKGKFKTRAGETHEHMNGGEYSLASARHSTFSSEPNEQYNAMESIVRSSEDEIHEFISISNSEADTSSPESESSITPLAGRLGSPAARHAKTRESLSKDCGNKPAPVNKQLLDTITDPVGHVPKQRRCGGTSPNSSQTGCLEDAFQKLQIFNEDSELDRPLNTTNEKPISESIVQKKTLPPLPLKMPRISESPWKPEHKKFWDPEETFAWIDEQPPEKSPDSPKKRRGEQDTETATQPSHGTISEKRDAKKAFDAAKEKLARDFLQELDERITEGQLSRETKDTGGLRIKWSNTLLTTAGRAHCSRKYASMMAKHTDGSTKTYQTTLLHASIELASKVLSNKADLLNTVAHEFCHLAVFILERKPRMTHGVEFKAWGARCDRAFGDRGIHVTTKHSYKIDYKYIWECARCGAEVKRHSKSVDPVKSRCGICGGKLVQVQPVPRGASRGATASGTEVVATQKKPNAWQVFVGNEMKVLSQNNPGMSFKDRMAAVSAKWAKIRQQQKQ